MNRPAELSQDPEAVKRKPSVSDLGQEAEFDILQQWQEQALEPLKEDVVEWLNLTLGCTIKLEDFLSFLDDGIILCDLMQQIHAKAVECKVNQDIQVKCKKNAKSGTWFARDNIANFLKWCKMYGVKDECMFETEGLVSHRNEKEVILCLLELARIGMNYGLEPPRLIAMEREIDRTHFKTDLAKGDEERGYDKDSKTQNGLASHVAASPSRPQSSKKDKLDKQVTKLAMACTCEERFQVNRLGEGDYVINGKNMFVRLLKGRHVMVRVGGGWDTLQHYIVTHDPCRIKQFRRDGNPAKSTHQADFLHVKGRYRPSSQK